MTVKIEKSEALSNLGMTPLIDIVFLLLIFFLVATEFAEEEREMSVQVPEASEAKPLTSRPEEIFVNVTAEGKYYVTGKVVTLEELFPILRQASVNNRHQPVIVRADRRCRWEFVMAVINACGKAKIRDCRATTIQSS